SALETFRGGGLTSALEGSDEAQISRALSERQSAAERLIALQEKLGITQVGNNEIALSQQRDAENAANRIAAIRTNAIIKERQDLDKQIKARIEAAAEEQTIRAKSIGEEIEKLAQLRTALGTQVQLAGFAQSNITGGTDTTALTEALGRRSVSSVDALSNALQPTVVKINQLIGILQRDPSRVTPEQRSESNTLRAEILADIASIRGRDVTRESLETRLQGRLGTPEGGIAPLIGAPDRVSQEEIDKDIKAVLAVFDALEEGAKRLTAGTDTLLDSRLELQQAQEQAVSDAKAVTQAEKDRLNALEIGTDGQKENVKAQESLTDLLARRNALDTQTIDATVAAPQLANSYKSAVQAAAPDVKKSQIEAVIAAERERQRINAQATAGPDAAEKAAEATTQSAFLSRKIAAEERRDQRAAAIQNARDIQTARIEAAKKADEEERKEAVDPTLREQALGQEDIGQAAAALEVFERGGEAAAKAALKVAEQADVERRFGPTDAQIPSPLAVAPGRRGEVFEGGLGFGEDRPLGPQPLIKGTRELSDHFDTANSRLDLFNEQLQATVDILLGNRASDAVAKKERDFIPEVPVQDRQLGGTGSAIQSFTFDEDGSRAARLETLTREQDKAAQSLANLSIVIDNLLRRPSFFPNSIDEFVPNTGLMGFADGGQVPGIGNSDSVPAMLTPGEYVVDKETTRRFLPDLIRMRNMRPRRYQNGGSVSNVNFGGFNVTESNSPQTTALEIQRIINRGVRQGIIKIK
ncbi:hypothetical protein KAU11_06615, partial [Candidatus Babeliales bacterium]|nr:hypothetical protein [Candidatus Babeliales bacterium]